MSLYDIFGEDPASDTGSSGGKGLPSSLRLLQSKLQSKKAQLSLQRNVVSPVVDLSSRTRASGPATVLRPHKALPLGEGPPLSFIPKALKEDKVFLFGEVLVEDEYNPTAPTDYAEHKKKIDERKAKEKAAKLIAERLSREHQEEIAKRTVGAAIAPPQALVEEDTKLEAAPPAERALQMLPPSFMPLMGVGKGLGVAANIMSKFGYKEGAGLGREGQGMSTALKVERLGKNAGVIVNEHELTAARGEQSPPQQAVSSVPPPAPTVDMNDALKNSSRILLLRNMVAPEDIDDQLETEVKDEMKKYGQVNKVLIYRLLQVSDDEAVRIFVEFANVGQAIKAFVDLNGRYFGGRSIRASFYNLEDYNSNRFDK